jgi:hypothetical protein
VSPTGCWLRTQAFFAAAAVLPLFKDGKIVCALAMFCSDAALLLGAGPDAEWHCSMSARCSGFVSF